MEQTQTFNEAVSKNVKWWSEKIQQLFNQNNGDDSPNGKIVFALMNIPSLTAQKEITKGKIKCFESALSSLLIEAKDKPYLLTLEVDYYPNQLLLEAANKADINTNVFPCKTWTRINKDNSVEVSFGYGTVPSII